MCRCEFEYLGKLPLCFIVCAGVSAPVQEFEYLGKLPLHFIVCEFEYLGKLPLRFIVCAGVFLYCVRNLNTLVSCPFVL